MALDSENKPLSARLTEESFNEMEEIVLAEQGRKMASKIDRDLEPIPLSFDHIKQKPTEKDDLVARKFMTEMGKETARAFRDSILEAPEGDERVSNLYESYAKLKGLSYDETKNHFDEVRRARFREEASPLLSEIRQKQPTLFEWAARPENAQFVNDTNKLRNASLMVSMWESLKQGVRDRRLNGKVEDLIPLSQKALAPGASPWEQSLYRRRRDQLVQSAREMAWFDRVMRSRLEKTGKKIPQTDGDVSQSLSVASQVDDKTYVETLIDGIEKDGISPYRAFEYIAARVSDEKILTDTARTLPSSWPGLVSMAAWRIHPVAGAASVLPVFGFSYGMNQEAKFVELLREKGADMTNPESIDRVLADDIDTQELLSKSKLSGFATSLTEVGMSAGTGTVMRKYMPGVLAVAPARVAVGALGEGLEETTGDVAGELVIGRLPDPVQAIDSFLIGTALGGGTSTATETVVPLAERLMNGSRQGAQEKAKETPKPETKPEAKPETEESPVETKPEDTVKIDDPDEVELTEAVDFETEKQTNEGERHVRLPIQEVEDAKAKEEADIPIEEETEVEETPTLEEFTEQTERDIEIVNTMEQLAKTIHAIRSVASPLKKLGGPFNEEIPSVQNLLKATEGADFKVYLGKKEYDIIEVARLDAETISKLSLEPDGKTFAESYESLQNFHGNLQAAVEKFRAEYKEDRQKGLEKLERRLTGSFPEGSEGRKFAPVFVDMIRKADKAIEDLTGTDIAAVNVLDVGKSRFPDKVKSKTRKEYADDFREHLEETFGKKIADKVFENFPGPADLPLDQISGYYNNPIIEQVKKMPEEKQVELLRGTLGAGGKFRIGGQFFISASTNYSTYFHEYSHYVLTKMGQAYTYLKNKEAGDDKTAERKKGEGEQVPGVQRTKSKTDKQEGRKTGTPKRTEGLTEAQVDFIRFYERLYLLLGASKASIVKMRGLDFMPYKEGDPQHEQIGKPIGSMLEPAGSKLEENLNTADREDGPYFRNFSEIFARLMQKYVDNPDNVPEKARELFGDFLGRMGGGRIPAIELWLDKDRELKAEGKRMFSRILEAIALADVRKDLDAVAKEAGKEEAPAESNMERLAEAIMGREQQERIRLDNRSKWRIFSDAVKDAPKGMERFLDIISEQTGASLREVLIGDNEDIHLYFNFGEYEREDESPDMDYFEIDLEMGDFVPMYDIRIRKNNEAKEEFHYKFDKGLSVDWDNLDEDVAFKIADEINKAQGSNVIFESRPNRINPLSVEAMDATTVAMKRNMKSLLVDARGSVATTEELIGERRRNQESLEEFLFSLDNPLDRKEPEKQYAIGAARIAELTKTRNLAERDIERINADMERINSLMGKGGRERFSDLGKIQERWNVNIYGDDIARELDETWVSSLEKFMQDSQAVDEDGEPVLVHRFGGHEEKAEDLGKWFSDSEELVKRAFSDYGRRISKKGYYLSIKKPLVIDAKGAVWDSIALPTGHELGDFLHEKVSPSYMDRSEAVFTTNQIVYKMPDYIKKKYDGVIFKNIRESGDTEPTATTYFVFSQNQIKALESKGFDPEKVSIFESKPSKIVAQSKRVKAAAVNDILKKLAKADEQRENPDYREAFEKNKESVREDLGKRFPILEGLKEIQRQGRIDKEEVKTALGRSRLTLPDMITQGEAEVFPLDEAAALLGYDSAQELAKVLVAIPKDLDDIYTRMVRAKTDEQFDIENYSLKELILTEGLGGKYNDEREKLLKTELSWLHENFKNVYKEVLGKSVARLPSWQSIKSSAARSAAKMDIKELTNAKMERKAIRWSRAAAAALKKGDYDRALEYKIQEAKAYEMQKLAYKFDKYKEKSLGKVRKQYSKEANHRDSDAIAALQGFLTTAGFMKSPSRKIVAHLEGLKKYNALGYENVTNMIREALQKLGKGDTLTVDKFVTVMDTAEALWGLAKVAHDVTVQGKKQARHDVVEEAVGHLDKVKQIKGEPIGLLDSIKHSYNVLFLNAKKLLQILDSQGKTGGFFDKLIIKPMEKAEETYTAKYTEMSLKMQELFAKYREGQDKKAYHRPINAHEIGHVFKGKQELIGALLHTGNKGNLARLLHGYGWAQIDDFGELDMRNWNAFIERMHKEGMLTKKDYDLVQAIWDLNAEILPDAQRAHYEIFGTYYEEISHHKINTPFGEYAGGYYPAVASKEEQAQREITDDYNSVINGSFVASQVFPQAASGFTKLRAHSPRRKLGLDPNYALAHVGMVLRYTYLQPTILEASKILANPVLRRAMEAKRHGVYREWLEPWLADVVRQKRAKSVEGASDFFNQSLVNIRSLAAARIMFGNLANAGIQVTGMALAVPKVGLTPLLINVGASVTGNRRKDINEVSKFMRTRSGNIIFDARQEVEKLMTDKGKMGQGWDFLMRNAYFLQNITQSYVDRVVWSAGFDRAMGMGKSREEAVAYADNAVRDTQGSYEISELARGEKGNHFMRLFTMFSRFSIMRYNLMVSSYSEITEGENFNMIKHGPAVFNMALWTLFLPELMYASIMAYMFSGSGDDDEEKFKRFAMGAGLNMATGWMPVAGQLVSETLRTATGDSIAGAKMSPVTGLVDDTGRTLGYYRKAFGEDGDSYDLAIGMLKTMGLIVPLKPAEKALQGAAKIERGEVPEGEEARAIITGR